MQILRFYADNLIREFFTQGERYMSNSNDTNELDNYGVWVKKTPKDIPLDDSELAGDFSLDTDLPDIDSLNDDSIETTSDAPLEVSSDDFDISVDGITEETLDDPFAGVDFGEAQSTQDAVTEEPAVEESAGTTETSEDDFSLDDLSLDDIDTSIDIPEENSVEDTVIEEPAVEETVSEPAVETTEEAVSSDTTEEISLDDIEDGEVDLDSFLGDDSSSGSSDVDVSSEFGLDSSDDGNIDIDDFLGDSSASAAKKEEEIVEEDPLDINLSFDESANSFEVEDAAAEPVAAETSESPEERTTGEDLNTESIDLSDFGIGDEETEVKGPEDAIDEPKTDVVDYDMKVAADNDDDTSVSLSDVISGNVESDNTNETVTEETTEDLNTSIENTDTQISEKGAEILQQIVGELASLKDEIKNLKDDFAQIKSHESDLGIQEPKEEENTGFFSDGEEDDTIALSGDELNNILNNAEFTDETSEAPADELPEEEIVRSSNGQFESTIDNSAFEDSSIFDDSAADSEDDLSLTENSPEISEDLPDEIEIPKLDDEPTVETVSTEEAVSDPIDEIFKDDSVDSTLTSEKIDYISEDSNSTVSVDDELGDLDLPSPELDENFEVESEAEPEVEDSLEEPLTEETAIDEPVMDELAEETIEEEPAFETAAAEPTIVEEPAVDVQVTSNEEIPGDLKSEIKSVLSYMDQLLENLPEDKISEFAQSEHFVTYKKLFQELGLS